jgi:hypothetical protein
MVKIMNKLNLIILLSIIIPVSISTVAKADVFYTAKELPDDL